MNMYRAAQDSEIYLNEPDPETLPEEGYEHLPHFLVFEAIDAYEQETREWADSMWESRYFPGDF